MAQFAPSALLGSNVSPELPLRDFVEMGIFTCVDGIAGFLIALAILLIMRLRGCKSSIESHDHLPNSAA